MRQITFLIPGMGCRRCVREVTSRLRDVPGVQTMLADAPANRVTVTGTMTEAEVLTAFVGSEFTPQPISSEPEELASPPP